MRPRPAPVLALVLGLTLLGSCSSGNDDDEADSTLPSSSAPTTATATTPADPFAIPEVIDEAYVNKVLAALSQVSGEALRSIVANKKIGAEVPVMLRTIYNDPQYEQELESLVEVLRDGLAPFKNPPGNRRRSVQRLITTGPTCILVEVVSDFSEVLKAPKPDPADEIEILTLKPTQSSADPQNLNPTPWSISNSEVITAGDPPPERARCNA